MIGFRLLGVLWAFPLLALLHGCAPTSDEGPNDAGRTVIDGLDGSTVTTTCSAPALDVAACGVVDGMPYYGFYNGCNWCACIGGSIACNAVVCTEPDSGMPTTIPWDPSFCNFSSFGFLSGLLPEGETWICDDEGRVLRSACPPSAP